MNISHSSSPLLFCGFGSIEMNRNGVYKRRFPLRVRAHMVYFFLFLFARALAGVQSQA